MTVLTLVKSTEQRATGTGAFGQYLTERGYSTNTVTAYLSDVRRYVTDDMTHEDHVRTAARVLDERSAPSTRGRRLSALAAFYAFVNPDAGRNPYKEVRRPTKGVVLPAVVSTPDEAREIIASLLARGTTTALRTATAVALMAGAGLRVSEVCALRYGDLNLQSGSLRVVDGKGSKTRDVPLSDAVLDVLRTYSTRIHSQAPSPDEYILGVSVRTVQRDLSEAVKAAGNERNLHPHAFRHGFATAVYRATTDLRLTADLLGHSSVTTTQIYTHIADDRRATAVTSAL